VDVIRGTAKFRPSDKTVEVNGQTYQGKHVLIAVGGHPNIPRDIPGANYGITSDGFFELESLPKKTVVVGAGYIAVELAGILGQLGSETHLLIRYDQVLRHGFDSELSQFITEEIEHSGTVRLHKQTHVTSVEKDASSSTLNVKLDNGSVISGVDCLIWAVGRSPKNR